MTKCLDFATDQLASAGAARANASAANQLTDKRNATPFLASARYHPATGAQALHFASISACAKSSPAEFHGNVMPPFGRNGALGRSTVRGHLFFLALDPDLAGADL